MKRLVYILLSIAVLAQVYLAFEILSNKRESKTLNEELFEISKVKYGIFNADEWRVILTEIVSKKIDELEITDENREEMRSKIEEMLYRAVNILETEYEEEHSSGIGGFIKRKGASIFGIFQHIRDNIPEITTDVLAYLENPEKRSQLKGFMERKIADYERETFAETDYSLYNEVLEKYGVKSKEEARRIIQERDAALGSRIYYYLIPTAVIFVLMVLMSIFYKNHNRYSLALIIFYALVLLIMGVLVPMIEIDARIQELSFSLLGERVVFEDQMLYYRNKSILEVVEVLIDQGKPDLIGVGVLVLAFSVLFPVSKMISSLLFLFGDWARENKFIRLIIFKSGKWSMADVMVVAIFMSYLGFSGILTEQLKQLENVSNLVDILTTNYSKLNEGFYLFTGFVILSIFISSKMQKMEHSKQSFNTR